MPEATDSLAQLFQRQIQVLALTRQPSTIRSYRGTAHRFLTYLRSAAAEVVEVSHLRRDPHLLGWFRSLCEQQPPLSVKSRWSHLLLLRRLLDDLAAAGHAMAAGLIRAEDFPPLPAYLPRALSYEEDRRLQQQFQQAGGWEASALLLVRLTGMRIGECLDLAADCLRQIGPDVWGVHIPLGKLHTERMVPADAAIRQTVADILALCPHAGSAPRDANRFLLPRTGSRAALYRRLRAVLTQAAQRANCSAPVTPHPLRHTFASEMVRLGVSLPALMQLLGHKDIRMTLRYVKITPMDLQCEFYAARSKAAESYAVPVRLLPHASTAAGPAGICQALAATRHLLEMYRRQFSDEKTGRKLHRLDHRLLAVATEVQKLAANEK
jgi:site-specific recombinase XerD